MLTLTIDGVLKSPFHKLNDTIETLMLDIKRLPITDFQLLDNFITFLDASWHHC